MQDQASLIGLMYGKQGQWYKEAAKTQHSRILSYRACNWLAEFPVIHFQTLRLTKGQKNILGKPSYL